MKKLLCATLLIALSVPALSQEEEKTSWRIGLTANPLFGWFKTQKANEELDAVSNDGLKVGFSYGAMGAYQFADNYALEIRIHHLMYQGGYQVAFKDKKNFTSNSTNDYQVKRRDWDLQYLNLPLNLKLKTNQIGYFTFFGKFGITPGFNLQSRATEKRLKVSNGNLKRPKVENITVNSRFMNFGVNIGLGAMYQLGGDTYLNGGITFHNGLAQVDDKSKYDIKPAYISLDLGILF
jgi:hypothetical protein